LIDGNRKELLSSFTFCTRLSERIREDPPFDVGEIDLESICNPEEASNEGKDE